VKKIAQMAALSAAFGGGVFVNWALAQVPTPEDPLTVAPAHYKVRFENDRVRVLEGIDAPGEKIAMHGHPDTLMVGLSSFKRKLTLGNGRVIETESKPGDVRWMPAQSHAGENIGNTETRALFIEFKLSAR
jgi:quercetin dioxygenase-like cupin family protein